MARRVLMIDAEKCVLQFWEKERAGNISSTFFSPKLAAHFSQTPHLMVLARATDA